MHLSISNTVEMRDNNKTGPTNYVDKISRILSRGTAEIARTII